MRIRRTILVDPKRGQFFHVVSRVVDRRFIFGEKEKTLFMRFMRQYEGFTGVQVVSYCLMSNHFHLLLYVPPRPDVIPEEEVMRRMKCLYSKDQIKEFLSQLEELEGESFQKQREEFLDKFRIRMFNLSQFVRELKLRFSKYFNAFNDRKGTLWEERFRCSLIEGKPNALMNTAAYIELNPVRAGLVNHPKEYRWCSYSEALTGGESARRGIIGLATGMNLPLSYSEAIVRYQEFFKFRSRIQEGKKRGIVSEKSGETQGGEASDLMAVGAVGKTRVFLHGLILGSREFIEEWYQKNKKALNVKRQRISSKLSIDHLGEEEIHTYRKVEHQP